MASIGAAWADGAWVVASWADGAWAAAEPVSAIVTSSGSWNPDWESYMPWAKKAAKKAANDDNKEEIVKKAIRRIYHGEPPPGNAKQIIEAKDAEGHLVKGLIKDKKALNEVLSTYFVMERAEAERLRLTEEQARINQMQVNDDYAIVLMLAS